MKQKVKKLVSFLKDSFIKLNVFIKKNTTISALLVFGFFVISFLLIYMKLPVLSSGDDHYFHFRFAERLLNNDFFHSFRDFKSIYFTGVAHGEHFLYYNFLFYAVLIPFTFLTPLYLGIKLFAIIFVALIGAVLYLFFKNLNIKYSFLWAIGFFAIIGLSSFWRLFLSRPFVFSPVIILLLILAIHRQTTSTTLRVNYFWIFILSFITLFWHTATFLIPLAVTVVYFLCYGFYHRKYLWKELLVVFLGTTASVVVATMIDPGFFISIRDNLFSVLSGVLNLSGKMVNIPEGGEVYAKNFFDFLNQNMFLCMMFIFAGVFYAISFLKEVKQATTFENSVKTRKIITMMLFFVSAIFLVAIPLISNRFSDFFIFFVWIFIVLVFSEIFSHIEFTKPNMKKLAGSAVLVCLLYLFVNNSLQLNTMFASSGSRPETFSEVGNYLAKNLKKDDVVFDVTWNFFPQLYYYAPEQDYVIGLEPKLTYLYSPRLYWLWQNIAKGYVCETEKCPEIEQRNNQEMRKQKTVLSWVQKKGDSIADVIVNDFQSHYIVSSRDYYQLNVVLDNSKRFQKVVNDSTNGLYVYKILDR